MKILLFIFAIASYGWSFAQLDTSLNREFRYPMLCQYEFSEYDKDTTTTEGKHLIDSFIVDQLYTKKGIEIKNPFIDIKSFDEVGKIEYFKAVKWKVYEGGDIRYEYEKLGIISTYYRMSSTEWVDEEGVRYGVLPNVIVARDTQMIIDPVEMTEWFDIFIQYGVEVVK